MGKEMPSSKRMKFSVGMPITDKTEPGGSEDVVRRMTCRANPPMIRQKRAGRKYLPLVLIMRIANFPDNHNYVNSSTQVNL
jgi:hypothetical protein